MRGTALALLMVAGGLSCGGHGTPNGKHGVLYFQRAPEEMPVAEGMRGDLFLPRVAGGFTVAKGTFAQHEFDFEETTLEVSTNDAVRIVSTTLLSGGDELYDGHMIHYECLPGSTGSHEVRVRVLDDDGDEQYADAFDVACAKADRLELVASPPQQIAGNSLTVTATLTSEGNPVGGYGVALVNPDGAVRVSPSLKLPLLQGPTSIFLSVVSTDGEPALTAGGVTEPIPVVLVPDDQWTLQVSAATLVDGMQRWVTFESRVRFGDGTTTYLDGTQPCVVEVSPAVITSPTTGCGGAVGVSAWPDELCVTVREKKGCASVPK